MKTSTSAALALLAAAGCSQNVQIPPARPLSLEAPRTVGAGERRARLQLSNHAALFNPSATAGDLRYRTGVADRLELQLDGTAVVLEDADMRHNVYLGRAGLKLDPAPGVLALHGGVGGGVSPAGGTMASADAGVTLGLPWRLVSPFVTGTTFISAPIEPRQVRTGPEPGDVDTPTVTAGVGLTVGLAFVRERYSIALGVDATTLSDEDGEETMMGAALAIELALD